MDELLERARVGNLDAIEEMLEECHGPLMKVWNEYRERMYERYIYTTTAKNKVAEKAQNASQKETSKFHGNTRAEYCGWLKRILYFWILEQMRPPPPPPRPDASPSPTEQLRKDCATIRDECKTDALILAKIHLSPLDHILIEMRLDQELTFAKIRKKIEEEHPAIWNTHAAELRSNQITKASFDRAKERLKTIATGIFADLWENNPDYERCKDHLGE